MSRTRALQLLFFATLALMAGAACDPVAPLGPFMDGPRPHEVPALSIIVVGPEKLLVDDSHGVRDAARKAPLAPGAIFRIGSMTEPITSLAAMMLREEGRLDLNAPVSRYLPEFDRVRVITSEVRRGENGAAYDSRPPARPRRVVSRADFGPLAMTDTAFAVHWKNATASSPFTLARTASG